MLHHNQTSKNEAQDGEKKSVHTLPLTDLKLVWSNLQRKNNNVDNDNKERQAQVEKYNRGHGGPELKAEKDHIDATKPEFTLRDDPTEPLVQFADIQQGTTLVGGASAGAGTLTALCLMGGQITTGSVRITGL